MRNFTFGAVLAVLGSLALVVFGGEPDRFRIGLAVFAVIAAIAVATVMSSARTRRRVFASRPDLGVEGIYREYYAREGIDQRVFSRVWMTCAETLCVPPGRLRPSDRLDHELKGLDPLLVTGGPVQHLLEDLTVAASRAGRSLDASTLNTLGDVVRELLYIEGRY